MWSKTRNLCWSVENLTFSQALDLIKSEKQREIFQVLLSSFQQSRREATPLVSTLGKGGRAGGRERGKRRVSSPPPPSPLRKPLGASARERRCQSWWRAAQSRVARSGGAQNRPNFAGVYLSFLSHALHGRPGFARRRRRRQLLCTRYPGHSGSRMVRAQRGARSHPSLKPEASPRVRVVRGGAPPRARRFTGTAEPPFPPRGRRRGA